MVYTIGLDYDTNSCRCVVVSVASGQEVGTSIYRYATGDSGITLDKQSIVDN